MRLPEAQGFAILQPRRRISRAQVSPARCGPVEGVGISPFPGGSSIGGTGLDRATRQRLAWAVAVGLLVAMGPFRPRGFVYAVAAGLVAALAAWIAVPRLAPTRAAERAESRARDEMLHGLEGEPAAPLRFASVPAWLCLAAYFLLFAKTLVWFYQNWTMGVWQNGHGLFVPVVMLALGMRALRREDWRESESSPWGVLLVAVALVLAVVDIPLQTLYLGALGFLVGLLGLALTFLGARRTRRLALPLALGLFMVPIPFALSDHVFLRLATAMGSVPILQLVGFSVVREYTVLLFPGFSLDISTACSGFSALYAGLFFGVVLAAFSRPRWRQFLVLAMVLPLALLANISRAVFLVEVTSLYGTGILGTDLHPASGAATFVLVIGGLALVAGRRALRSVFG